METNHRERMEAAEWHQTRTYLHPATCGACSDRRPLRPAAIDFRTRLVCDACGSVQDVPDHLVEAYRNREALEAANPSLFD